MILMLYQSIYPSLRNTKKIFSKRFSFGLCPFQTIRSSVPGAHYSLTSPTVMQVHKKTTLSISPGTRSMGIAVFKDGQLISWNVKSFPSKWTREKAHHIRNTIFSLLRYYQPRTVVIKKVDPIRSSVHLLSLVEGIITDTRKEKIRIWQYTLFDLQDFCGKEGRNIQRNIANTVVELFPELRNEYLRERNALRPYYNKMFEAVIAGAWYLKQ